MAEPPLRPCRRCGASFPGTSEFWYADRRRGDGLRVVCRACDRKRLDRYEAPKRARRAAARAARQDPAAVPALAALPLPPRRRNVSESVDAVVDDTTLVAMLRLARDLALGKPPKTERPPDKDMLKLLLERKLGPARHVVPADTTPIDALADRILTALQAKEPPADAAESGAGLASPAL